MGPILVAGHIGHSLSSIHAHSKDRSPQGKYREVQRAFRCVHFAALRIPVLRSHADNALELELQVQHHTAPDAGIRPAHLLRRNYDGECKAKLVHRRQNSLDIKQRGCMG